MTPRNPSKLSVTGAHANDVMLVSCRLAQDRLVECAFLESHGFRFIELNYRQTKWARGIPRWPGDLHPPG